MKSINLKSALKTGLIAGIIINISAISMLPAVGDEMNQALSSRGLPPLSNLSMAFFSCVSISIGIFLIFLYSLLKQHLVSKVRTAIIASLIVWFIAYFISNISLAVYGFLPLKLVITGTLWGLGELLIACLIGTKLYKEV